MTRLSLSRAWDETRAVLARDGRLLWPVGLGLLVLPSLLLTYGLAALGVKPPAPTGQASATTVVFLLLTLLVGLIRFTGLLTIALLALKPGERVRDALGRALRRAPVLFAATLLLLLPLAVLMGPALLSAGRTGQPDPGTSLLFLLGTIIAILLLTRFQLAAPVAVNESGGPLKLLSRSWALTRGSTFKLLGYVLLFLVLLLIVSLTLSSVVGSLVVMALGRPEPWSVAALLLSLLALLADLLVLLPYAVMTARLYAQGARRTTEPTVPHAP